MPGAGGTSRPWRRGGKPATSRLTPEAAREGRLTAEQAPYQPTSEILDGLLDDESPEQVTLAWLIDRLRDRSFGIILLLIALVGMLPTVATFTGLVMLIPAYQMIRAHPYPVLPGFIARRRLSTRGIARLIARIMPLLRWLERFSYPRWTTPFSATKRVVGVVVLLLALSLQSPLPFSQIVPNLVVILIAFAYLEADGLLLAVSLVLAFVSIAFTAAAIWGTVIAAGWL